ncbi:MAG: VWA domain-containing protein [Opitutaceae bacterium]
MGHFIFKDPIWLLALAVLPLIVWMRGRRRVPVLLVPFAAAWHRPSLASVSRWPVVMGLGAVGLLIVALARPQRVEDKREVRSQGYDIMLAVDLSGSMRAEDYEKGGSRINRLQAVKPVIQAFIEERTADRIGVVLFAGKAYTMAPLTFDHHWLAKQLERVRLGMIEDGTAIGDGIGVALTRLEQAKRETGGKRMGAFIVLLTDGASNRGALTPQQATDLAKARGIPIYTIGAGKDGWVPMPVFNNDGRRAGQRMVMSDLDEGELREIASQTGGAFFRATDNDTIEAAFKAIDKAQKIEFQAQSYLIATELFWWLAAPGFAVLIVAALLARPPGWSRSPAGKQTRRVRGATSPPTDVPMAEPQQTSS